MKKMTEKGMMWSLIIIVFLIIGSVGGYFLFTKKPIDNEDEPKIMEISLGADYLIRNLTIQVALPDGYWNDTEQVYSCIYLLDANYFFGENGTLDRIMTRKEGMTNITQKLINEGKIPPSILIGISYSEHERNEYTMRNVSLLYRFFTEELIPEIERRFRVSESSKDRILFGYSGSGHFSTYALLNDAYTGVATFDKVISISGAYDATSTTFQLEEQLFADRGTNIFQNKSFYMAIGEDDANIVLVEDHQVFVENFISRGYSNLNFNYTIYEDKGHYDLPEIAYETAMIWLFNEK